MLNNQVPLRDTRFGGGERFARIQRRAADLDTPVLLVDLEIVRSRYLTLQELLPATHIYYAVKANPMPEVLTLLNDLGSNFDIASRYELDLLLQLGVRPERISFGNTIKKRRDIAYAREHGVDLFVSDSMEDVINISELAPGARVFFRIFTQGTGSDWPLTRKFGAHPSRIVSIIAESAKRALVPFGISFHVGSQQRDIGAWDDALATSKAVFDELAADGIHLQMINLGGGFPSEYLHPTLRIEEYAGALRRFLNHRFGDQMPMVLCEPGRYMVGDAGVLVSEVVLIAQKVQHGLYRWVYLDVGTFGGLIETIGEAIKYPLCFDADGTPEPVIIAGPTCDSMDVLYEDFKYEMPSGAKPGDRVYFYSTGAYTYTYSSAAFNGFPPLSTAVL
jgi:ornithine decarboxylase